MPPTTECQPERLTFLPAIVPEGSTREARMRSSECEPAAVPPAFMWHGLPVLRICGWCRRRLVDSDTAIGEPVPADTWPTTDGICRDCKARQ